MNNFLVTLTNILFTQVHIHDYFKQYSNVHITQQELHKSGVPHFHVYIKCDLTRDKLLDIVNDFNPPINNHTNDVRGPLKSVPATYKYVTKDKTFIPLYHNITPEEVKKAINRYKNGYKDNTDIIKFKNRSIEVIRDLDTIRKQQRADLEDRLDKTLSLIKLFQSIGDEDALQYVKKQFESLLEQRYNYLTSDEIYKIYTYTDNGKREALLQEVLQKPKETMV